MMSVLAPLLAFDASDPEATVAIGQLFTSFAVGGAAIAYSVADIATVMLEADSLSPFAEGAVLFFIRFLALAIRAMYHAERPGRDGRDWFPRGPTTPSSRSSSPPGGEPSSSGATGRTR